MQDQAAQSRAEAAHSASYTYSFADYQASRVARRKLSPIEYALWPWRYALLVGVNIAILLFIAWHGGLTVEEFLSWAFLSELIDRVLPAWVFRRYSMANKRLDFVFRDDGISWSCEGFKGEFDWSKVTKMVTLKDYLFLFISKLEAVCIPQRAFPSKDVFDRFIIYAKERANG